LKRFTKSAIEFCFLLFTFVRWCLKPTRLDINAVECFKKPALKLKLRLSDEAKNREKIPHLNRIALQIKILLRHSAALDTMGVELNLNYLIRG
jgi:hypothetical protein